MAVRSAVTQISVTGWPLGIDKLTVNTALLGPLLPSVTVTSLMLRVGASASECRSAWPGVRPNTALVGLLRFTKNVLSACANAWPLTMTVIVLLVSPGLKIRPDPADIKR